MRSEASAEAAYNTNGGEWKPQVNGLFGWKSAYGNLGVILQGFYEERSVVRYGQEVLGWQNITTGMPLATAQSSISRSKSVIG